MYVKANKKILKTKPILMTRIRFQKTNNLILHADLPTLAKDTQIQGFFESPQLVEMSMNRLVHAADAARLLLLHRFEIISDKGRNLEGLKDCVALYRRKIGRWSVLFSFNTV